MAEDHLVVGYQLRGVHYSITVERHTGNDGRTVLIQVEDKSTADQWKATFEKQYIEDLTHKTGNFKQYDIFLSMLESALKQESDAVSLDLLTYSDLEALRSRKTGGSNKTAPTTHASNFNTKRYLILTYTVEFDRIHYPLPLPYMGKVDPAILQETICKLREQLKAAQKHTKKDFRNRELEKLKAEFQNVLEEKHEIEEEFMNYRRSVENTSLGNAAKEIKILKSLAKSLEQDMAEQRAKHMHSANRRKQDYNKLLNEAEDLRASDRNLRVRVKSLTNELAIYRKKMGRALAHQPRNQTTSTTRDRSSSRERLKDTSHLSGGSQHSTRRNNSRNTSQLSAASSRYSSNSRDNSRLSRNSADSYTSRSRPRDRSYRPPSRDRSYSWERSRPPRDRSDSRERTNNMVSFRSRTPSPSFPRFDPTAYVKEKEKRNNLKKEANHRRQRSRTRSRESFPSQSPGYSSYNNRTNRSRNSSVGSFRSRTSSIESLSDIGVASDSSAQQNHRLNRRPNSAGSYRSATSSSWDSPRNGMPPKKKNESVVRNKKIMSSTPESRGKPMSRVFTDKGNQLSSNKGGEHEYFDRSAEILEIDERLNRLQEFMKNNLT